MDECIGCGYNLIYCKCFGCPEKLHRLIIDVVENLYNKDRHQEFYKRFDGLDYYRHWDLKNIILDAKYQLFLFGDYTQVSDENKRPDKEDRAKQRNVIKNNLNEYLSQVEQYIKQKL
jgi:recombinational DNA repair protein (RecF pathway)